MAYNRTDATAADVKLRLAQEEARQGNGSSIGDVDSETSSSLGNSAVGYLTFALNAEETR